MHACVFVWCVCLRDRGRKRERRERQKGYWRWEETSVGRKVRIERMGRVQQVKIISCNILQGIIIKPRSISNECTLKGGGWIKALHTLRETRSKEHYEGKVSLQLTVTHIQDV